MFTISAELAPPSLCHCGQCRRQSGHVWASTHIPDNGLTLTDRASLRWFESSPGFRRGFCGVCGSFLFWKNEAEDEFSVAMGAIDAPTGQHVARHIFVADKGDYSDIADNLPRQA
ncbi:GFA family protein [Sedimentitalea sp. HM32M-2]|uniref:GFA family protein n=1 Tax=Sedimentitalea sp. HM32M-2 TaxID=3351566 RepID=UPI0036D425BA